MNIFTLAIAIALVVANVELAIAVLCLALVAHTVNQAWQYITDGVTTPSTTT